jgi:hypothetical protein
VQVDGLGRVTVGSRRDRRRERERDAGPGGCLAEIGEMLVEALAALTWPFVAAWGLVRLLRRDGPKRHAAIPSGPADGEAYRVAEALKQHTGEIVVVRGKSRVALAEAADSDAEPAVVWTGSGGCRPQWSPSPASLYWDDGSMLLLPVVR